MSEPSKAPRPPLVGEDGSAPYRDVIKPLFLSALFHFGLAVAIYFVLPPADTQKPRFVRVEIHTVEKKAEISPPPESKKEEPPKEKESKPKLARDKLSTPRKTKKPASPAVKPVQGLAASTFSADGKGLAAAAGNTLRVGDDGTRLRPEDVKELSSEDQSSFAKLISASVTAPVYTEEAIDANLEGLVVVDVYVDAQGVVSDAELKKKVGYGMDALILSAARKARFSPRKDKYGRSIAGWAEIKFRLEIP